MHDHQESRPKSSSTTLVAVVIALIVIGAIYFFISDSKDPVTQPVTTSPVTPTPQAPVEQPAVTPQPEVVYEAPQPIEEVEPLPLLNESDTPVLDALRGLRGDSLLALIVPQEVIRKFVLAVNGVAEGKVVNEYRPLVSPPPPFIPETFTVTVEGSAVEQQRIALANYARYETYVNNLALLDMDTVAAIYRRFYPLLEEAFKELGLKKSNFHSVLIAAIDNVLAAPDVQGEVLLIQPKVFYQYADPVLEKMPQTHKLMVRMGPENARSVKASLRQLRARLLSQ
ncbi:DUF3014 domain-containing protein [Cellvibrio japonicus]|uniref:DUF3014 domain-containing protein n=1 Tax=Cellvibrio japonicus (strain Ueda107) TaxID=498211 RepID=B3PBU2_CELJU|nr:DUF3014 domain-containing protein [Cellvibrio japonicus]ACE83760.1 conserved hypothetical protein [Cellvibrio japonicus Ueda107]QEI11760.1 DUF3014 domain-containing protein [Cellvibrio japonicus]QEI15334.1 DUF3014 domain-containing protein [Cellvibrio japonicus]QEI18914.1 DUF3014 domain-containing protein [Cellvibrio japonicus]